MVDKALKISDSGKPGCVCVCADTLTHTGRDTHNLGNPDREQPLKGLEDMSYMVDELIIHSFTDPCLSYYIYIEAAPIKTPLPL